MAASSEAAVPASLVGESSALSSSTKQNASADGGSGPRFNYRSYGTPRINRAVAESLGAEYLPEVNMVKMRIG
jgi:hypothetical protein